MKTRILLTIFVACLATFTTSFVHAQDDALARARSAFDTAQGLFQTEKYPEAAEQFKLAYQARPFGQFLFNIGACYEKSQDYQQALDYYKKYLDSKPPETDAKNTQERIVALEKAIAEKQAGATEPSKEMENLSKIEIQGVVVIVSEPAGFDIYLDDPKGKPFAKTPWNGTLSGTHTVYVQRKGYKSGERKIEPKAEKFETVVFVLGEEDYLGYLEVSSNIPGASIYMDDKSIGAIAKTPWSDEVKPGKYTLWITKEGYSEFKTEVEIIPGETTKIKAELEGAEVGYLNVRGTGVENVSVYVDGKLLCERGPCLKPLDPGKHNVSIRRGDHKSYNRTIEIQSKTEVTMRADLAKKPSRVDAYVAYLFSAAFVGGGYYLGTKAQDLEAELRAEIAAGNPPPDNNDSRFGFSASSGKTYAIAADVGYVLGGASFLLAVYYTFRDKGKSSTGSVDIRAISFEPQITPTYSGFGLAGRF